MLQQHGDVVLEIRISKASRVTRQRQTWKSALGLGVSAAFVGLSAWLDQSGDDDLTRAASAAASLLAHLLAGRWTVEETRPLPRDNGDMRLYRVLRAAEFAKGALIIAATIWIGFLGVDGLLWFAFALLVPSAFASTVAIEHFFQQLFERIGERSMAAGPDRDAS